MMVSSELKKQLAWQCRRGMLELDVIFEPFLNEHFSELTEGQQKVFAELLKEADPDLFSWFMGYSQCPEPKLAEMVQLIRERVGALK